MRRIVLPYQEAVNTFKVITTLSKSDRHCPNYQQAMLVYRNAEAVQKLFNTNDGKDRLFLRTENQLAILQLTLSAEGKGMTDGWKASVEIGKLKEALLVLRKEKLEEVDLFVNEASVRIGKIRIKTEDPSRFLRTPRGVSEAQYVTTIPNPSEPIARVEHCVGDEGVPSVAILPGQLLAAHRAQAILVDCTLIPDGNPLMVPAKELKYVAYVGDTVQVRISKQHLVLRGDQGLLGIMRQRWSKNMNEAIKLFKSASFTDQIVAEREGLVLALKTAIKVLGKDADAELTFTKETGGHLRSVEEGNEVQIDFDAHISSGKTYKLTLVMRMLLKAVEFTPQEQIVFKIPDLSQGPSTVIHLVDAHSHEVIALGVTGQLRAE